MIDDYLDLSRNEVQLCGGGGYKNCSIDFGVCTLLLNGTNGTNAAVSKEFACVCQTQYRNYKLLCRVTRLSFFSKKNCCMLSFKTSYTGYGPDCLMTDLDILGPRYVLLTMTILQVVSVMTLAFLLFLELRKVIMIKCIIIYVLYLYQFL